MGVTVDSPANTPAPPPSGDNVAKPDYLHYDTERNGYMNHFVAFSTGTTVTTPANLNPDRYQPYHIFTDVYRSRDGKILNGPNNFGSAGVDSTGLGAATSFAVGWVDSSDRFHPYSFLTGAFIYGYGEGKLDANTIQDRRIGTVFNEIPKGHKDMLVDPRTTRFSHIFKYFGQPSEFVGNNTLFPDKNKDWKANTCRPQGMGFQYIDNGGIYHGSGIYVTDWAYNNESGSAYYADPDGVVRPGDGLAGIPQTGDGMMLFTSNASPQDGSVYASGDSGGNVQHGRRPVILNRPFQSVGELGYAFRDLPFKSLDFFTTASADAGLLDVFSLEDSANVLSDRLESVVAGRINFNFSPSPVIAAVLEGAGKKDLDVNYNLSNESGLIATGLANYLKPDAGNSPLSNPADLVQVLGMDPNTRSGVVRNAYASSSDRGNKAYLEAPVRALANVSETRTWNLFIDVIAQSGQLSVNAAELDDFVVNGETRYWLHVAIDRYTGEVVAQRMEAVYE